MMESTGSIDDAIKQLLANDDEATREYLKESFLLEAMTALFHARRAAGLTQAQLAERLHTKQSSIARLERDFTGSMTLRRFVEVAIACGVVPLDLTLAPLEQVARYATEAPDAERTQVAFSAWEAAQPAQAPDDSQRQPGERAAEAGKV
jgi:transcriptional regulator with XRE-family HTH domain